MESAKPPAEIPSHTGNTQRSDPPIASTSKRPLIGAVVGIFLFALANGSYFKLLDLEVFGSSAWTTLPLGLIWGGILAQFGLLALWGALGLGKTWIRQVSILGVGGIWIAAFLGGSLLSVYGMGSLFGREAAGVLCVPFILLLGQFPLWCFRVFGRWGLSDNIATTTNRPTQLSIADLLVATVVIGTAMALVNLGYAVSFSESKGNWWMATGIACAVECGYCLILLAPLCPLMLRPKSWVKATLLSGLLIFGELGLEVAAVYVWDGARGRLDWLLAFAFTSIASGLTPGLLLPLLLLRRANYRLLWGRETDGLPGPVTPKMPDSPSPGAISHLDHVPQIEN